MAGADPLFGIHAQALQLHQQRAEVIANNISNADTPGYRAKDLDFASILQDETKSQRVEPRKTDEKPTLISDSSLDFALKDTPAKQAARDGNTVDSQVEMVKFAQNTFQYQASLNFLNAHIRQIMTAIKGE